jgi:predicted membrane protein
MRTTPLIRRILRASAWSLLILAGVMIWKANDVGRSHGQGWRYAMLIGAVGCGMLAGVGMRLRHPSRTDPDQD